MSADQIAFQVPKRKINEQSTLVVTAKFRTRSTSAAATPTNVKYRLDCLATGVVLLDWTAASASSSVDLTVTTTQNKIQNDFNALETKQLTVASDYGLTTMYVDRTTWDVRNLQGLTS